MSLSIQILIPSSAIAMKEVYLKGMVDKSSIDNSITVYFYAYATKLKHFSKANDESNRIYGYCNRVVKNKSDTLQWQFTNYLLLKRAINKGIRKLVIDRNEIASPNINTMFIYYDYNAMKNSENLTVSPIIYKDTFSRLHLLIQNEENKHKRQRREYNPMFIKPNWLSSTMFGQHLVNYIQLLSWFIHSFKFNRKVSLKQGNLLLAILADVALGYLMLNLINEHKDYLSTQIMLLLKELVSSMHTLLDWLKGTPAGLKLNNAFNVMLGKYFSYNIQLWTLFLEVIGEKLDMIFSVFNCLGYLGLTIQATIISDLMSITTFHSYCIYVYAARLFNLQLSGLIALMRLFVGRKYNPLRGCIDSCEYNNQELFVGTVAFTILLFLLPTTTLYYIVFTLFRFLSMAAQCIIAKIIYWIHTLPLYTLVLWMIRSPKIAGNVCISVLNDTEGQPLVLKVDVFPKSLGYLLNSSKPPVEAQNSIDWSVFLSNLLRGKQLS